MLRPTIKLAAMHGSRSAETVLFLFVVSYIQREVYSIAEPLKLELASVVFRHGDRSPVRTFPKDRYDESYWPQGFGQLSLLGMQQHYMLGELFRTRYVKKENLLHSNYTRVQVYVRSTDYDRTLMSVQTQLAALYPPDEEQRFNSSIPWQPIPVHTVPQEADNLLKAYALECPRYSELRQEDEQSLEYKEREEMYKDFLSKVQENTGLVPTTLSNVWMVQDTLLVEDDNGLGRPTWLNNSEWEILREIVTYTLNLMFSSTEKSRLTAGNWVGKVVGDMVTRRDSQENDMRLYLYSAHDTTVAAMSTALGVYNKILPPYATALIIELYSDSNSDYWVSLYYRNETADSKTLIKLEVEACNDTIHCTLEEFIRYTAPIIPNDWEKECGLTGGNNNTSSNKGDVSLGDVVVLSILFALSLMALILVTSALLLFVLRRNRRIKNQINFVKMEDDGL